MEGRRKEEKKEGRKKEGKKGRMEGRKEEGRKEGRKERRKEGRKEGRNEGTKERRNEGRNEGTKAGTLRFFVYSVNYFTLLCGVFLQSLIKWRQDTFESHCKASGNLYITLSGPLIDVFGSPFNVLGATKFGTLSGKL